MKSNVRRVLIVDDDAMVRRLLARHFEKRGAIVVEAADAEQALDAFNLGTEFDVVIADVHLPGKNGLQLASQVRALRANQPIVFITGDEDDAIARRALVAGNSRFLAKPFDLPDLDSAVARVLNTPLPSQRNQLAVIGTVVAVLLLIAWFVGYVLLTPNH